MGFNNENARRLIFDIETAPLPEAVNYLEPVEAPANYKDPAKIDAYKAEKQAENLDRCGLDVDLCRVVAVGMWREGLETGPSVASAQDISEANLLRAFWFEATDAHLVGFNCIGFDLPVLLRRSLYLGIKTPDLPVDRYRHTGITDLAQLLSFNGMLKLRGLSFYAKRFGFDVPDDVTGADIAALVAAGKWADIEAHCKADVRKTALLAEKLGYFSGVPALTF